MQVDAAGRQFRGDLDPGHERRMSLSPAHRRFNGEIACAVPDPAHDEPRDLNRGGRPHVDHDQTGAHGGPDRVDRRSAGQERLDHLNGHGRGIRRDPFSNHAVIGGHDDNRWVFDWERRPTDSGELDSEGLEPSEAAGRLGERGLAGSCGGQNAGVEWLDGRDRPGEYAHRVVDRRGRAHQAAEALLVSTMPAPAPRKRRVAAPPRSS